MTDPLFVELETVAEKAGIPAALDRLIEILRERKDYQQLFEARLIRKRYDMGLPLTQTRTGDQLETNQRREFEDYYIDTCRLVGRLYLEEGDIPRAWPYLRLIGDTQAVAEAIDKLPTEAAAEQVIGIAFHEGANPRKGFEMILANYGTCSAITAFDQLAAQNPKDREHCLRMLARQLFRELTENLRAAIAKREGQPPAAGTIAELLAGRDWLFDDEGYYVDTSHLTAVIRFSLHAQDPEVLGLALEMTDYGRRLSSRLQYSGDPPFDEFHVDAAVYLRAMLGQEVESAIAHLRGKIAASADKAAPAAAALVNLLVSHQRYDPAIEIAQQYLSDLSQDGVACPSILELCQLAGDYRRMAELARRQGNLLGFAAALAQSPPSAGR